MFCVDTIFIRIVALRRYKDQILSGCLFSKKKKIIIINKTKQKKPNKIKQQKQRTNVLFVLHFNRKFGGLLPSSNESRTLNIVRHFCHPKVFMQAYDKYMYLSKIFKLEKNINFFPAKNKGCFYLRGCLDSNKYGFYL